MGTVCGANQAGICSRRVRSMAGTPSTKRVSTSSIRGLGRRSAGGLVMGGGRLRYPVCRSLTGGAGGREQVRDIGRDDLDP